MLVLSREAGTSIYVGSTDETCLITVLELFPERGAMSILVNRASAAIPGQLDSRTFEVPLHGAVRIGARADVTLVDLRVDKARVGINAPSDTSVHRWEVYEAIRRDNERNDNRGDSEDGMNGTPVPRPTMPKPPTLDIRLDEPRTGESGV